MFAGAELDVKHQWIPSVEIMSDPTQGPNRWPCDPRNGSKE